MNDFYDSDIILNGNYITIKKVNRSHSGLYQCLAEDGSKRPAMEAITLVVHCELIADSYPTGSRSALLVFIIYPFVSIEVF